VTRLVEGARPQFYEAKAGPLIEAQGGEVVVRGHSLDVGDPERRHLAAAIRWRDEAGSVEPGPQ
jgi:hypothetical protein